MGSPLSQEYIHMPEWDIRCQTKVLESARPGQVSSSVQVSSSELTTHDLQLWKVISPSFELRFWVFLDSMESPLSQEYIHMPEGHIICHTKVLDQARPG